MNNHGKVNIPYKSKTDDKEVLKILEIKSENLVVYIEDDITKTKNADDFYNEYDVINELSGYVLNTLVLATQKIIDSNQIVPKYLDQNYLLSLQYNLKHLFPIGTDYDVLLNVYICSILSNMKLLTDEFVTANLDEKFIPLFKKLENVETEEIFEELNLLLVLHNKVILALEYMGYLQFVDKPIAFNKREHLDSSQEIFDSIISNIKGLSELFLNSSIFAFNKPDISENFKPFLEGGDIFEKGE